MKNLRKIKLEARVYKRLPQEPGIYVFWRKGTPLYVGKAINLRNRVSSYFAADLLPKTSRMLASANFISYIPVTSELEALLLEARMVKLFKPHYNSALKDDKSPLYIKITDDYYPAVLTARVDQLKKGTKASYGPFPSSNNVRFVLKSLRRIFPFAEHKLGKRKCIYAHIGLCNPCPNEIENEKSPKEKKALRRRYLANIRYLKEVLSGKVERVKKDLRKNMKRASFLENYEEALGYREAINKFAYITQPITDVGEFLKNPNLAEDIRGKELQSLKVLLEKNAIQSSKLSRIECYDIAHLAGTNPTASMVTFINGAKDPSLYRHFRIRRAKAFDDISALSEVAKRRINYLKSWGKPDLIVVDGGKGQVSIFRNTFEKEGIPVIGISKRREALVIPKKKYATNTFVEIILEPGHILSLISRLRDEAHRFARRYHHKLVSKTLS
ncbi:hypothetical protein A3E15_01580 [Candidatus Woesebacteria bacterium RIFCSPHIGHO2_12_FULL_42_9]|uniref:Excinuclease ABC subunit C n=3 Tax=Candidatus Woeseibacteriota TaxID=1752722 RepID=A0A1F8AXX3_9BACT|nr:MAG: hypothetical protein A2112_01875 [Candidatus Woesebacteria bacterium GWA1_42_12]OGM06199.1 MAG: hypothetical protein A2129_00065 [Candidatus Woesebacteria bacterium GWC1_42_13]OGM56359.1 MAG: hypothetical protein A3E15_01580 [Candidatus Woesebacteria bacterium RIFCSPHIGHO2_12_FULL_42_9]